MVTRSALPQNYLRSQTLFEGFGTRTDWTVTDSQTIESDTTNYKIGSSALKLTCAAAGGAKKQLASPTDMAAKSRHMSLWVYFYSDPATTVQYFKLSFSSTADPFYKQMNTAFSGVFFHPGWNRIEIARSDFGSNISESWSNQMRSMGIRIVPLAGQTAIATIAGLYVDVETTPTIQIQFDGASDTVYSVAYPYMDALGLRGSIFLTSGWIGMADRMSLAQLQELYAKGWTIANHTDTHPDMRTLSVADQLAQITTCRNYLVNNGMPKGQNYFVYPFGYYNDEVIATAKSAGTVLARTIVPNHESGEPGDMWQLNGRGTSLANGDTLTKIKGVVDKAIDAQAQLALFFHALKTPTTDDTDWTIADFQALIDYIVARKIKVITLDEWYNGLTNPRYQSLPVGRT